MKEKLTLPEHRKRRLNGDGRRFHLIGHFRGEILETQKKREIVAETAPISTDGDLMQDEHLLEAGCRI